MFGGEPEAVGAGERNLGGDGGLRLPPFTAFLHPKRVPSLLGPGGRLVLGEGWRRVLQRGCGVSLRVWGRV